MADKRKYNGGHSTKGFAGRKPKIDEIALIETMDSVLVPKTAWEKLAVLVKKGDVNAIKTWLQYRYGMPKQAIDHTSKGEQINIPPITWVDGNKQ